MSTLLGPRDENGIPVPMTVDESIASMKASLLKKIKRSAYVYRVDCGGCNGCEIEIFATLSPLFDAERFGIKVVPFRRAMPIFCCLPGQWTRAMPLPGAARLAVRRRIRRSVSPTAPAATAAASSTTCTASGAVPIKIVPGRRLYSGLPRRRQPPRCHGFAMALGLLEQKIHARLPGELDEQPTELLHADMVQPLRVRIDREARRPGGLPAMDGRLPMTICVCLARATARCCAGWRRRKIRV
ncbi:formate hydrogenlyase subunit 7 [Klebsiella pneumoniae]|uniref:Formate hydrogenlyase subunit 7 n=1 Tax=Klebsiella pneumoniae TaxID=573 RepID=A0A377VZ05_KLEPN|nr:formate hydrogenlyase subunit 7 [Klebsiella pneumoniae]